jgi:hypothetical protein
MTVQELSGADLWSYLRTGAHKALCGGKQGVIASYVRNEALQQQDAKLLAIVPKTHRLRSGKDTMNYANMKGFAIINTRHDHIYVDVICGSGYGSILFDSIFNMANRLKKKSVQLSSLALPMMRYYIRYGFRFNNRNADILANSLVAQSKRIQSNKSLTNTQKEKQLLQLTAALRTSLSRRGFGSNGNGYRMRKNIY